MCSHQISIANFTHLESVTYPIIKIIGNVIIESCQKNASQNVLLFMNDNAKPLITNLSNNNFKFLLELKEGRNNVNIQYCINSLNLALDYIPAKSEYAVIPLYVICEGHDGRFQSPRNEENSVESARRRITLCVKLLQCVAAEKLFESSLGRKTFQITDECQIFRSKLNFLEARKMNQEELWKTIGNYLEFPTLLKLCLYIP